MEGRALSRPIILPAVGPDIRDGTAPVPPTVWYSWKGKEKQALPRPRGISIAATATDHCGSDNAERWRVSSSMAVLLTP